MSRSSLKFLAIFIGVLLVIVPFAGLDGLPRSLRTQVEQERTALASSQSQLRSAQDEVLGDLRSQSDLFQAVPASQTWPNDLSKALGDLQLASHDMDQLSALAKRNRRQDRAQVESLLAHTRSLRAGASAAASSIEKQAAYWVNLKNHLPETLSQMERDYQTIRSFDFAPLATAIGKAGTDWPDRRTDLDSKLSAVESMVPQANQAWENSADARRAAAAGDVAHVDFAALAGAADTLKTDAAELPKQSAELQALAGQLYNAWDKILVDMQDRGGQYQQKIRTVSTHLADASAKTGQVSSNENWVDVSPAVYDSEKSNLGMAIAHKAAGKYDDEAERVAQPAGFAYIAPPGQGSNQYGYWDHRDGRDFWVFYGQYALLRDLLFNYNYQPLPRGDWEEYRTYSSRGQTYYGRDTASGQSAPKYGSQGTTTQNRYSGSTFAKRGGFSDSKYATRSGSYSDSKYATPSGDRSPRQFGSGSSSSGRTASPAPRPRPSYRPPSPPRRYGRR